VIEKKAADEKQVTALDLKPAQIPLL